MRRHALWTVCLQTAALIVATGAACDSPAQESPGAIANAPSPQLVSSSPRERLDWKPQSHFPNPFAPYTTQIIAPPRFVNTPRLEQLLRDGKLFLSLNDAVALALENNLDLVIARINLKIADTDIGRAQAGSSISGVNTGIIQNTPGGSANGIGGQFGSGQGGTTLGAGGAGAGSGGLVGSTLGSGATVSSFDPVLTGSLEIDRLKTECNTPLCATSENTTAVSFSYTQGFHWGTDIAIDFDSSRVNSNSIENELNPALNAHFQFRVTQHLLQGFGLSTNTRYIEIAKNNRRISDAAFRSQIVATVNQIENMYWDLVNAYESAKVQKKQMEYARQLLANDKRQMEIGSLTAIEVVRAQSAVATEQQNLTVAETNLELAQLLMKNAIARTLDDPVLADAQVVPTSTIQLPASDAEVPTQDLVNEALNLRPDIEEARITLKNTEINIKAIRNALLPTADLSAYYGGAGLGGSPNPNYICLIAPVACGIQQPPAVIPSLSYGDTLNQLINSSAPDKGIVLNISIPIRNRAAQATQVRAELERQQSQVLMRQLENQVRIEVRNAQFAVKQNRASVDAAQAAVDLARQSLDLERKKFEDRASTAILVLQNEVALTQAEETLIAAKIAYQKAVIGLDQVTGRLLDDAGISIVDARRGEVTQAPNVPNVPAASADSRDAVRY